MLWDSRLFTRRDLEEEEGLVLSLDDFLCWQKGGGSWWIVCEFKSSQWHLIWCLLTLLLFFFLCFDAGVCDWGVCAFGSEVSLSSSANDDGRVALTFLSLHSIKLCAPLVSTTTAKVTC